ncbi:hypothetical protein X798_04761 [Onchocerca flexuosa]|uniref:Cyclin N-terminal domain-containing protein n=1 Tax=Onchocerca flexuosa TaxID=387005 RepID=A0A238BSI8_9BILA|nr:hypothetical protein X798_04761 [Onchocerca flexuosa]
MLFTRLSRHEVVLCHYTILVPSAMSAASVTTNISTSQAAASDERQSAAAASVSASVPSSSRWIFTHEQLMRVPSIREGMLPEEELKRRRVSASTIHQMADRLNHESRVRISQLCICAAMMHMHRFFVFHSFFKFDPRDIAAACLFLAGKSEECPRKLDHVVRVWWAIKFPHSPNLDNNRLHDASQLIVTLENLVLQTIGNFSQLYIYSCSIRFVSGHTASIRPDAHAKICTRLHMTNWGVRYTAKAIACVCIQMACLWAEFEVSDAKISNLFFLWYSIRTDEEDCNRSQKECLLDEATLSCGCMRVAQRNNSCKAVMRCFLHSAISIACCGSFNADHEKKEVTVVVSGTISLSGASRCYSCTSLKACTVAQLTTKKKLHVGNLPLRFVGRNTQTYRGKEREIEYQNLNKVSSNEKVREQKSIRIGLTDVILAGIMAFQGVQFQIQTTPDEAPWYKQVDPTMSLDKLLSELYSLFRILYYRLKIFSKSDLIFCLELTEEFSRIYKTHGESLNIKKYAMRSSLRETATPQNPNQPQQQSLQQPSSQQQRQGQNQITPSIATLPPPPVAPQLNAAVAVKGTEPARRIDLSDYKLRNNAAHQQQQSMSSQNSVAQTQRRNFMRPDVLPQTTGKGLDLPLPPIIANGNKPPDQVTAKPTEAAKIVQMSKSGTSKPTGLQKPAITNVSKTLHPIRQLTGTNEQERYKKPKPDDEKDLKHRKTEKTSAEGSHHRKRFHENNVAVSQTDNSSTTATAIITNVTSTSKSGTPKPTERHNPVISVNHVTSGGYSITSKSRDEAASQSLKRDSNSTSTNTRGRDESISSRQRDDMTAVKKARQTAPLIALLPTPPSSNTASVISTNSQNSKYNLSTVQTNRSNHIGEGTHRTNATTNWSVTNDYYMGPSSNNASRFSQLSGSSNHRHYSSSSAVRIKSREPLLSTPDPGNSYYKRSRPRPPSPITATTSNAYRQSQRSSSPGNRSGSSFTRCCCRQYVYKITPCRSSPIYRRGEWRRRSWQSRMSYSSDTGTSNSTHILSALPPPPLPPPNEELEDGEIFNAFTVICLRSVLVLSSILDRETNPPEWMKSDE